MRRRPGGGCRDSRCALVVESHPVDHGLVARVAEHARSRVARLGQGRDGADLHMAETEGRRRRPRPGILVEAGGESDRVREAQPEGLDRSRGRGEAVPGLERPAEGRDCAQRGHRLDATAMGAL
jgi:hypothetical protein